MAIDYCDPGSPDYNPFQCSIQMQQQGSSKLPPNLAVDKDGNLVSASGQEAVNVRPGDVFKYGGTYWLWDGTKMQEPTALQLRENGIDPNALPGGGGSRLTSDDPRYWANQQAQLDLQYAQLDEQSKEHVDTLAYQYYNAGLDAESARRQALMSWIQTRGSLASNTAQTSADVAKQAAQFAANPRDTYAEALYRGQVGGSTPFGDLNNSAFGEYGKALAAKAASIFSPVNEDLNKSRAYRDAIPPLDFLSPAQQAQLGGSPSQLNVNGATGGVGTAASVNPLSSFVGASPEQLAAINKIADQANPLRSFVGATPEQLAAIRQIAAQRAASPTPQTTPPMNVGGLPAPTSGGTAPPSFIQQPTDSGLLGPTVRPMPTGIGGTLPGGIPAKPVAYGKGGTIDFGQLTRFGGDQPTSSEGGTNMNIHEPAVLIGLHSGRHYATVAENGYPEQIKITPTPSGKKAAMEAEKAGKAQKDVMGKAFGQGGTIGADPSLDDMNAQYSKLLERLGGSGGGSSTPYGGARFLAGAPANAIQDDPYLKGITDAGYSMRGVDPNELWAQVAKFTPQGMVNNSPRVSFA